MLVFFPLVLAFFVLYLAVSFAICLIVPMTDNQIKSAKVLGLERYWRAPGKLLEVRETMDGSSDIIIPDDFLNEENGETLDSCKHLSLRKSLECTVQDDLRKGPFGTKIENDSDNDRPHYLLHGWTGPYDPSGDELWCTHARTATWAAIYSWSVWLPTGNWTKWSQAIDLGTAPEVLGYIYLFGVGNPDFYNEPRIARIGALSGNSPDHTLETENKVFARYNYRQTKYLGDFPKGDPDAFVFKGERVLREANLQLLHQYRVMNPKKQHAEVVRADASTC
eukprot:jgi/Psemu1/308938/fgenesh1_kg.458_\